MITIPRRRQGWSLFFAIFANFRQKMGIYHRNQFYGHSLLPRTAVIWVKNAKMFRAKFSPKFYYNVSGEILVLDLACLSQSRSGWYQCNTYLHYYDDSGHDIGCNAHVGNERFALTWQRQTSIEIYDLHGSRMHACSQKKWNVYPYAAILTHRLALASKKFLPFLFGNSSIQI
jgi:hypothetical protein